MRHSPFELMKINYKMLILMQQMNFVTHLIFIPYAISYRPRVFECTTKR